jgi:hypothetical protein
MKKRKFRALEACPRENLKGEKMEPLMTKRRSAPFDASMNFNPLQVKSIPQVERSWRQRILIEMADRRRINGPGSVTVAPVFEADEFAVSTRTRAPNGIRSQCEF